MIMTYLKNSIVEKLNFFFHKYQVNILTISIGIIYLWFGLLKFFPNWSPAEGLATKTLSILVFHAIDNNILIIILALVEVFIGISLIIRIKTKALMYLVFIHMFGTFAPFFLMTEITFNKPPFGFSIIGQYILKNIVIISGLIIVFSKNNHQIKYQNEKTV